MLLCEANQWPADVVEYFGDPAIGGDECHMAFHFPVMPRIFMAVRRESRYPISEIMAQTPEIPDNCQWGIFLRNHDELTLEMVTDEERDYMWSEYAKDPRMKANIGIRRRLAPLLENDINQIELFTALLLSLPGSPVLYYGDEIGMGDNIWLGDRDGVRTPMQWTPDRNAGFSTCDPGRLYLPVNMDSIYGYQVTNVESQTRNTSSLLHWTRRMIQVRKANPAFGMGTFTDIGGSNPSVLSFVREFGDDIVLCVNNLSRFPQPVELDLRPWEGAQPIELIGGAHFPRDRRAALPADPGRPRLLLAAHPARAAPTGEPARAEEVTDVSGDTTTDWRRTDPTSGRSLGARRSAGSPARAATATVRVDRLAELPSHPRGDDLDRARRLRGRRPRDATSCRWSMHGRAGRDARARAARHARTDAGRSLGLRRAARQGGHAGLADAASRDERRRRAACASPATPTADDDPGRRAQPGADRRAVQHLAGVRRRGDPEGVPPAAAGHQPDIEIGAALTRARRHATCRGCSAPSRPTSTASLTRWRCCRSS